MNDIGGIFVGLAISAIALAAWHWFAHSRPTHFGLEFSRRRLVRARAEYAGDLARLQAYEASLQDDAEREVSERTV